MPDVYWYTLMKRGCLTPLASMRARRARAIYPGIRHPHSTDARSQQRTPGRAHTTIHSLPRAYIVLEASMACVLSRCTVTRTCPGVATTCSKCFIRCAASAARRARASTHVVFVRVHRCVHVGVDKLCYDCTSMYTSVQTYACIPTPSHMRVADR